MENNKITVNIERSDQHFLVRFYSLIEVVSYINHDSPQILPNAGSGHTLYFLTQIFKLKPLLNQIRKPKIDFFTLF